MTVVQEIVSILTKTRDKLVLAKLHDRDTERREKKLEVAKLRYRNTPAWKHSRRFAGA